jgi:hypothetical protein
MWNDIEIGKLEADYSKILAPLLDKNYIYVNCYMA